MHVVLICVHCLARSQVPNFAKFFLKQNLLKNAASNILTLTSSSSSSSSLVGFFFCLRLSGLRYIHFSQYLCCQTVFRWRQLRVSDWNLFTESNRAAPAAMHSRGCQSIQLRAVGFFFFFSFIRLHKNRIWKANITNLMLCGFALSVSRLKQTNKNVTSPLPKK